MSREKNSRMTQIQRVMRLRELLDTRLFVTVAELRREFGVSRRTVYNDFEALQAAGIPLFNEKGPDNRARWQLPASARRKAIRPSTDRICQLLLSGRVIIKAHADDKPNGQTPGNARESQAPMAGEAPTEVVDVVAKPISILANLESVVSCLQYNSVARIQFTSGRRQAQEFLFESYTLVIGVHSSRVFGRSPTNARTASVDLSSIRHITVLRDTFEYPGRDSHLRPDGVEYGLACEA